MARPMKKPEPCGLADDMTVHRLEQIFARGVRRQIQFCVERIEFEHIVMKRTGTRPGAEICGRLTHARRNARTVACSVRQIAGS